MYPSIKRLSLSIVTTLVLFSCNNEASLQTYFVDHQEAANFITADLPTTLVDLDEHEFTNEEREAYNSIKRLNFLGYKIEENGIESYKAELSNVKTILSHKKYIELAEFNYNGAKFIVKYIGDDELVDELIIFGSSTDVGFGVARVLGDIMSVVKMASLVNVMQNANVDQTQFDGIMNCVK